MALKNKIDSNVTGLRFIEEAALKVLPSTATHQVWFPLEPNTYGDFGGEVTTIARSPINASRQRSKGVVTDLDANAGIVQDITQENLLRLMQGFLFADAREKPDSAGLSRERTFTAAGAQDDAPTTIAFTAVDGANSEYDAAAGLDVFVAGHLVLASGFTNAANNGLKVVAGVTSDTNVEVVETVVDEASPPAAARLQAVGFQFASGDLSVDVGADQFPVINSAADAFLGLGLIPGEWIFVGGDSAATSFATAAMSGFARIRSVAADGSSITLDKTVRSWGTVDDAGTSKTIQIFFGTVVKNESDPDLIKRRSYQLERTLGVPDDTATGKQAEYTVGSVPNELTINIPTADKATIDFSFVALDSETHNENDDGGTTKIKSQRTGVVAPAIVESDAFNTSSDVKRLRIGTVAAADSFPSAFFGFAQELTVTVNNNVTADKAIGVLGGFDVTVGQFDVGGSATAYFQSVASVASVRNNDDATLDMHLVKSNAGITVDLPLVSIGNARPNVEPNAPITLPVETEAATGRKINSALDHTLLMVFWPYLPDLAG
jgi:hypothetical protein